MSSSETESLQINIGSPSDEVPIWKYHRIEKIIIIDRSDKNTKDSVIFDHKQKKRIDTIYLRPSDEDQLYYKAKEHLFRYNLITQNAQGPLQRYRERRDLFRAIGDYPCEFNKFWELAEKNAGALDRKQYNTAFDHQTLTRIHHWPEDYVEIPKEELHLVEIPLSPGTTSRVVGRVFFDKEVQYLPQEATRVPRLKLPPVRHFQPVGEQGDEYWEEIKLSEYIRKPRAEIYKPKEGNGILKVLTAPGQREQYWKERLAYISSTVEDPDYPEQHQEVIRNIFGELMKNSDNLQNWFNTTTSLLQSDKDIKKEWSRKYKYYMNQKYRRLLAASADIRLSYSKALHYKVRRAHNARIIRGFGMKYKFLPRTYQQKAAKIGPHYLSLQPTPKKTSEPTIPPTAIEILKKKFYISTTFLHVVYTLSTCLHYKTTT